jgi:hypothetical protein
VEGEKQVQRTWAPSAAVPRRTPSEYLGTGRAGGMLRDPCGMLRDPCGMLRDPYGMLRDPYGMLRDPYGIRWTALAYGSPTARRRQGPL